MAINAQIVPYENKLVLEIKEEGRSQIKREKNGLSKKCTSIPV